MTCRVMLRPQTYNEVRTGLQTIICDSCQRILYFNPAEEMLDLKPSTTRAKRHHPKIDAPQAWYYRAEFGDIGEVFLCLTNSRGQASRRVYDVHTGRLIGDILIREGDYRQAFPEDITGAMRLNGSWTEAELDAFGTELPMVALDSLRADLDLARHEAATGSHVKAAGSRLRRPNRPPAISRSAMHLSARRVRAKPSMWGQPSSAVDRAQLDLVHQPSGLAIRGLSADRDFMSTTSQHDAEISGSQDVA